MEEIAASFEAAGLPGGFHLAAADLYRSSKAFKDGTHGAQARRGDCGFRARRAAA